MERTWFIDDRLEPIVGNIWFVQFEFGSKLMERRRKVPLLDRFGVEFDRADKIRLLSYVLGGGLRGDRIVFLVQSDD